MGFAVEPKLDCEHLARYTPIPDSLVSRASEVLAAPCAEEDCASTAENWLCLACGGVYCARYVNEHMVSHNEMTRLDDVDAPGGAPTGHCVCISFSDLSVWCYACDSCAYLCGWEGGQQRVADARRSGGLLSQISSTTA